MKTCSKCGRTYPNHVDFCLRDGHPLVAGSAEGVSPDPTPSPSSAKDDGSALPIDLLATTDAFFPSLQSPPEDASEEGDPSKKSAELPADPNLDLVSTDIISVSRVREAIKQHKKQGPISLLSPNRRRSKATAQTELIPRNWREQLDEIGNPQDPAFGDTDPITTQSKPTEDAAIEDSKNSEEQKASAVTTEERPTNPSIKSQDVAPESNITQERPSMPFVFDGMGDDDIPSGFEDSTPLEDENVENTGVLSRSFIQRTLQEAAKEVQPWEAEKAEAGEFVPRGEREEGAAILEESSLQEGFAPPKGSFRRRAAFSHWSVSTQEEPTDPASPGLQELGASAIEVAELTEDASPKPSQKEDPWFDPMASATAQTPAAQLPFEEDAQPKTSSRGWMWAALAIMIIGVGAVLGFSMQKKSTSNSAPLASANQNESRALSTKLGAPAKDKLEIDIANSQPMTGSEGTQQNHPTSTVIAPTPTAIPGTPQKQETPAAKQAVVSLPTHASLTIKGSPSTATIEFDGKTLGKFPQTLEIDDSQHTILVSKSGYVSQQKKIKVGLGETVVQTFQLKRKATPKKKPEATTRLIISSSIQGAEIFVNGRSVGKTPMTHQLTSGKHNIKVVAAGKAPYTTQINIPKGNNPKSFERVHAQF